MKKNVLILETNQKMSKEEKRKFAFWRNWNFVFMLLAYTMFYFVKYAYKKEYGDNASISASDFGTMAMVFNISYGVSKFLSGNIADRSNARYFMCIGLFMTSIINLFSGAYDNIIFITIMLAFVAWFQGFGYPPISRMFAAWFTKKERGTRMGVWSISHNIGGGLAPFLVIPIAFIPNDAIGHMFVPSIIGIVGAVICFFALKEKPSVVNLPRVEKYLDVQIEDVDIKDQGVKSSFKNNVMTVIKNKWLWVFVGGYLAMMVFRLGVGDFMFKYIKDHHHLGDKKTSGSAGKVAFMLFEFIGIPASIFAGWFTDIMVRKGRGRFGVLLGATLVSLVGLGILWGAPIGNKAVIFTGIIITSFSVWMVISMGGPIVMDLSPKRAVATSVGFKGITTYVGASIIGDKISGVIISSHGWNAYFGFILAIGILGGFAFLALRIWKPQPKEDGKYKEEYDELKEQETN
ncbi:MFS transporter [Mycoplasma marinum]|uniref:Major facilitator superfamily (MFS) profile domain-containing protein n=1 Tax=Mycoplasma marinum TaxID=1937190 RepID=A0A4V2NI30_9MOLU|nr:MFS transporter [Mycoplasma marinum]TCG11278.1 hypothetical protein C4B24_02425 [Mycoplasma marinum]